MDLNRFWSIVEVGRDSPEPEAVLAEELKKLPVDEIASYQEHFDTLVENAYRWDLWGAAYIIEGGCSDDGFMDFRYGLISKGRQVYEKALENPDSLADLADDEISNESFGYVAFEVYEEKTGSEIPRKDSLEPPDPVGEQWDFDDDEENTSRLPRLAEKYSAASDDAGSGPSQEKKPWYKFW